MNVKGQGHSLTLVKGHSDFKVKTCFSQKQFGHLKPKLIWKLKGVGNENLYKWVGHMTNMATMPIYGKNLKKSSSPEPIDWWPWNLVCSIVYASTTKVVQIMTLDWSWPISHQGQIWLHKLLYGKRGNFFLKPLQP